MTHSISCRQSCCSFFSTFWLTKKSKLTTPINSHYSIFFQILLMQSLIINQVHIQNTPIQDTPTDVPLPKTQWQRGAHARRRRAPCFVSASFLPLLFSAFFSHEFQGWCGFPVSVWIMQYIWGGSVPLWVQLPAAAPSRNSCQCTPGNESTCNRACSRGVLKSPPTLSGHRFRKKAFALARTACCALSEIKGEAKVESEKCRFTQSENVLFTKQFSFAASLAWQN